MSTASTSNGHTLAASSGNGPGFVLSADTREFLSGLFDDLAKRLQPVESRFAEAQAEYLTGHLGVPEAERTVVARRFPAWAANHVLVAVDSVLGAPPYRIHEVVDFGAQGRAAPTYRSVSVAPDQAREVMEEGWYAVFHHEVPLAVHVELLYGRTTRLRVRVAAPTEHKAIGQSLVVQIADYPNFYRRQIITVDEDGDPEFVSVPFVAVEDVVLDPAAWLEIERQVVEFASLEGAFRAARLPFRRGVILAGPPGVGKTLVFRALTHRLAGQCTVLWLTAGGIPDAAAVTRVFEFARSLAPTLMLWEDLDLTVRDRTAGRGTVLGELLAQLDGPASAEGVIVCASTNDPSVLDEALSARPSRFDRIVYLGQPVEEARVRMLRRFVADVPDMTADLAWVAHQTSGFSGAELRELVVTAFAESQRSADGATALESRHFEVALQQFATATAAARRSGVRSRRRQSVGFGFATIAGG